jgi:protein involved in polysaccharide export with SLBB domain
MKTPMKPGPTFRSAWSLLAMAAVILLAACASRPQTVAVADANAQASHYRLGAGDKVKVNVFGDESLSGEHQVDGNGTFTFPLVGNVKAAGLTSAELEQSLRSHLNEYLRDPRVSVEVEGYRPFYIVGEVKNPGSYPYVDGMTVINAVAIAGGFTYRAKDSEFDIQRKDNQALDARQATKVLPGDVIVVRERFF